MREEVTSSAMTGDEEGEEKTEMRKRKENIKSRWEQEKGVKKTQIREPKRGMRPKPVAPAS
jgi:hypothetical protein